MKNSIKITLVIITFLLIIVCIYLGKNEIRLNTDLSSSTTTGQEVSSQVPITENSKTYIEKDGIFSFLYNSGFVIQDDMKNQTTDWMLNNADQTSGILLATLTIPRLFMSNTNFSEARFTVGRSSNPKDIKSCLVKSVYEDPAVIDQEISGIPFKRFSSSDAAAGNFYETTSYRAIVDGDCYALEYTIHSTNIGNYSPDQGIKEFDKSKVTKELESIIESFKFLINTN